jgi:hypothetical protein
MPVFPAGFCKNRNYHRGKEAETLNPGEENSLGEANHQTEYVGDSAGSWYQYRLILLKIYVLPLSRVGA